MGKASRSKQGDGSRQEKIAAQRAAERRRQNRVRLLIGGSAVVAIGLIVGLILALAPSRTSSSTASNQVLPPGVTSGTPVSQGPAVQTTSTSGIPGVTAWITTGWPTTSNNGPAAEALSHNHVDGPVTYTVNPPVGGVHNAEWMNCGIYDQPVPSERAVHNLEHGAVWITYQPSLPQDEVSALRAFVEHQSVITPAGAAASRFMDLTPYTGLSSPIVISSWGFQLKVTSPSDPRLQEFVDKFRASATYTPEYGSPCTGGLGTPLET